MQISLDRDELLIIVGITFFVGGFVGYKIHRPNCPKPEVIHAESNQVVSTAISYPPKQIDPITKLPEKTDIDVKIKKPELSIKVNGHEGVIKKADDEKFLFDNNKLSLEQSSKADININIPDLTKHWSLIGGAYYNTLERQIRPAGGLKYPVYRSIGGLTLAGPNIVFTGLTLDFNL